MSTSHQQLALRRKVTYAVLIVGLLTLSLVHRRSGVEPMANDLQLREVARGEVELTSSAVRLLLTGSRGMAVTFLWHSAMDKQAKHEWNELELLVTSITKLQPHFVSPWLFQSWNMSFNVAVECDRPRDKYYYISRGLELLGEGERKNHKPPAPGNPDMRHHMGFTYQLKIGNSDEKNVMRCLLELSCVDPLHRNPDKFWQAGERGREVNLSEFFTFCAKYPRLVRRLAEQLPYNTPEKIIAFLEDHRDIPSRFQRATGGAQQTESMLKDPTEQFPILPPPIHDFSPDPKNAVLSAREAVDVFFVARAWYEYAQLPLPPPDRELRYDPVFTTALYRKPRYMMMEIFRGYPARAQAYIGENLEAEGWFDADGWVMRNWFDSQLSLNEPEKRVGTQSIYHAGPAWEKAYQMYKDYGTKTGLYFSPGEIADMEKLAVLFRKTHPDALRPDIEFSNFRQKSPEMQASFDAHRKLTRSKSVSSTANYDANLMQAEAERKPETVLARKMFFRAERLRRFENPEKALELYEEVWPLWTQVLLTHPEFAKLFHVQEETYDFSLNARVLAQEQRPQLFKAICLDLAQAVNWSAAMSMGAGLQPGGLWLAAPIVFDPEYKSKVLPIRNSRGQLEWTMMYTGPGADGLTSALASWSHGAGLGMRLPSPYALSLPLVATLARDATPPQNDWLVLIAPHTVEIARGRVRPAQPTAKKE